jgi:excisionase family DNA binding protein
MGVVMNVRDMTEETCCGTTRASKLLHVSVGTVHHLVEKGELESWRTAGGHRRITLRSVRNYQLRRGLITGAVTNYSQMNVIVLACQQENMAQFKSALSANVIPAINVTYFTNPLQMVFELKSLTPQLVLLDKAALEELGGITWLSQFRSYYKLSHVSAVLLCDKVEVDEMAVVLINKVTVVTQPLETAWLMGYVHALATSWELSSQI